MGRSAKVTTWMTALGAVTLVAACSLGIDASRIPWPSSEDAGLPPVALDGGQDRGAVDAGPVPDGAAPVGCTTPDDCRTDHGCLKGRCDVASRTCVYDVCPQTAACTVAACNVTTGRCGDPAVVSFRAGSFPLQRSTFGCGGSVAACLAVVWPFVFTGTQQGVIAYQVSDPTSAAPPVHYVGGVPFVPQQVVTSGRRVYFLGPMTGSSSVNRLPVAWLEVPGSPFATPLRAQSLFVTYADVSVNGAFTGPDGSVFLVHGDAARLFPVGILRAPLTETSSLDAFPLAGLMAGSAPLVASGSRLLSYRYDGVASQAHLTVHTLAGTGGSQALPEQSLGAFGAVDGVRTATQGPGGSVFFAAPILTPLDVGGTAVSSVRGAWVLDGAASSTMELGQRPDLETFAPPLPAPVAVLGPVVALSDKRVLVTTAFKDNPAQAVVQVASRETTPPVMETRRFAVPAAAGSLGVQASEGWAYVAAPDGPDGATIHVFAPSCAP